MKIKDIVILVGGQGSRLGSITKITPKPLIKINNIPFLDQLIIKLIKYSFKNIYLLCSYKKEFFFKRYNNKIIHKTKIKCIDEGKQKGTGGALYKIKKKIKYNFILINGDTFFDVDLNFLIKKKLNKKNIFMCLTTKNKMINNHKLNNLLIKNENIGISNKSTNLTNGGIYLIKKVILNKIKNKYYSFENDILYNEIQKNKVIGKTFNETFIDIGSPQKLKFIKKNSHIIQNKCFFLDRDGVINQERGYITNFRNFIFLKGVKRAINYLNEMGYLVIVITNQAAVGKGILSEEKLNIIHHKMKRQLSQNKNAYIDDIYYAPYYKNSKYLKYRKNKYDRKPNPGMIIKAQKKWNISLERSFFIGDKFTDKLVSEKCNLKFYYKNKDSLYEQIKKII